MKLGPYSIQLTAKGWLAVFLIACTGVFLFVVAWVLGLFAFLITILIALFQLLWAALVWFAAQTGLLSIFSAVLGLVNTLWLWFGSTALGSWLLPLLAKLGPVLTLGGWTRRLWRWTKQLHQRATRKTEAALEKMSD